MTLILRLCSIAVSLVLFEPCIVGGQSQAGAGGVMQQQEGPRFKKLRSVSGAAGHEANGKFIMDDARSEFTAGKDQKVIVYFEWEGSLGLHHFEGLWKSPEGKIVLISDFSYVATGPEFSGYWTMLLSSATPSGEWTLEARIDGEAAGTHSFIITGSPVPPAPAVPQPLSAADLYKQALNATVVLEKMATDGTVLGKRTGFWIANGELLTSFDAIDGAASLRLQLHNGNQIATDQVIAWNRWQDWALLKAPGAAPAVLKRGPKTDVNVGDQCYFLEWSAEGAKLVDGTISGKNSFPRAGARLLVASVASQQSFGGALLNQYGDYVGVMGGAIAPGGDPGRILALMNQTTERTSYIETEANGLAVPLSMLSDPEPNTAPTLLTTLAQKGEFLPLVVKSRSIGMASLTSYIEKRSKEHPYATDYRQVFSRREGKATVFVNWTPVEKQKTTCRLRLYNIDNQLLTEAKPLTLLLAPGKFMTTSWDLPLGGLSPGIYRVDLLLGDQTVWRDFLRVTE